MIKYINNTILHEASKIKYSVAEIAPDTFESLINSSSLVVWSGASDQTVFQDETVNWALRALHDKCHLETKLNFTPDQEIELGRIQANKYARQGQQLIADLIYIEVAEQAAYYKTHGRFLDDQVEFTLNKLKNLGYTL